MAKCKDCIHEELCMDKFKMIIFGMRPTIMTFAVTENGNKRTILRSEYMDKICKFISDNTPTDNPNILTMVQRDDGDIEIRTIIRHHQEGGISFRASGSRLKNYAKVIQKLSEIIDLIKEDERYSCAVRVEQEARRNNQ